MFKKVKATSSYRPEIDGLRAFAVLAVIIDHFNKALLPSGYLGVDIFFVISGYVITLSLLNRTYSSFKEFFLGFYTRRIKRLIPALVVFVALTGIFVCLVNPNSTTSIKTGLFSLFGFSNLLLLQLSTDYFGTTARLNAFTHTWSLGVEEQFYFVFPFLFWFSGLSRQTQNGARNLLIVLGVLSTASMIAFIHLNQSNPSAAYFLMPSRFWELGAGCLLCLSLERKSSIETWILKKIKPGIAISLFVATLFIPIDYRVPATFTIVLLTVVLIVSLQSDGWVYNVLTFQPIVYIGRMSYSLYLYHWGVLVIGFWSIGIDNYSWWSVPIQLGLIFVLAFTSYRYVETPLRSRQWSPSQKLTIAYGLGASIGCAGMLLVLSKPLKEFLYIRKDNKFTNVHVMIKDLGCQSPTSSNPIETCLSRVSNSPHIFIMGDSHASNLYPSILDASKFFGYSVRYLGDRALANYLLGIKRCEGTVCAEDEVIARENFIRASVKPGDIVLFSMARDRIYNNMNFEGVSRRGNENKDAMNSLTRSLQGLFETTKTVGAKFVVVDDIPKLCNEGVFQTRVVAIGDFSACSVAESISLDDRLPLTQIYKKLETEGALYIDPHSRLCKDTCTISMGSRVLYADASPHFSNTVFNPLTKLFKESLNSQADVRVERLLP